MTWTDKQFSNPAKNNLEKQFAKFTKKKVIRNNNLQIYSIKHDQTRSYFQLWPRVGDEGDNISEKYWGGVYQFQAIKCARRRRQPAIFYCIEIGKAETVIFRFVTLRANYEGHN